MILKEYQIWYFPIRAIYNSDLLFFQSYKDQDCAWLFGYKGELDIPLTVL